MKQIFSGISFCNFGCTLRGWPKIPENRNNRKILVSPGLKIEFNMADRQASKYIIGSLSDKRLTYHNKL